VNICSGRFRFVAWLGEEQKEQNLRELQTVEHELDIARQRMKLELLKKKLAGLDASAQVRLDSSPE